MFKEKFITHIMGMATWYGLFSMVFDTIKGQFIGPLVIVSVCAFMAWSRK